ncbi:hypothetical protein SAMN02745126_02708 [Enhydrobacter aerosaccus]|uniref:HdeA/HdeB family protein n=1 Tax=Enhydrobacter aerosaccus TaxID=225324 RepID=A0A1T4PAZ1_9HYPH|nr:hypothetical protein [Enhydrobacter aerosaccus]SJZ88672.1 hypothetical protein SAMN02745126_02708 [Enhydrobacter aerosaccus]
MINQSALRAMATASAVALAFGLALSASAQTAQDEKSECQRLYGQWSKYNGTSSYSKEMDADMALEDCNKGNTAAGIAELKEVLNRGKIPLPESETAATPETRPSTH